MYLLAGYLVCKHSTGVEMFRPAHRIGGGV